MCLGIPEVYAFPKNSMSFLLLLCIYTALTALYSGIKNVDIPREQLSTSSIEWKEPRKYSESSISADFCTNRNHTIWKNSAKQGLLDYLSNILLFDEKIDFTKLFRIH